MQKENLISRNIKNLIQRVNEKKEMLARSLEEAEEKDGENLEDDKRK